MITKLKLPIVILTALMSITAVVAQADGAQQDARAVDVLEKMAANKKSLDQVTITGVSFTDARLGSGLMVANSEELQVSVDRPASMYIKSFDGESKKEIYFHNGLLTVFSSENKLYAQAEIPKEIDAAMDFVLEELGIEAPLMDLIYHDASVQLISSDETILYLTDKSRIGATDCHQIAIRGSEVDVQLWVEEGDRPMPRKIMITSKWKGGSPRFTANLHWDTDPEFKPGMFEFQAPEGATKIEFVTGGSE